MRSYQRKKRRAKSRSKCVKIVERGLRNIGIGERRKMVHDRDRRDKVALTAKTFRKVLKEKKKKSR